MLRPQTNWAVAASLLFAIALWGGNNTGAKLLVSAWPPAFVGSTRFFCAGLLLLAVLRLTRWLGHAPAPGPEWRRPLWFRGGMTLAAYIVVFNWAVRYTSASHVALYLGAAPVWALLWERWSEGGQAWGYRYVAALLALTGVGVLVWPVWEAGSGQFLGELLGLAASFLWAAYGRQCRTLTASLSGAEVTAQTMWRAGVWLAPVAMVELGQQDIDFALPLVGIQLYCIVAGGVVAFALWNHALQRWPSSQVLLYNNFIPVSTMVWSYFWLGETVTNTFWLAMILVASGVLLGQLSLRQSQSAST